MEKKGVAYLAGALQRSFSAGPEEGRWVVLMILEYLVGVGFGQGYRR